MFYVASNSNFDAIFVFTGVDLYNRILISNQISDLKISAFSTYRTYQIFLWSKTEVSRSFLASGKSMVKLLFLGSICAVFSFNLVYCRPNSVKYVKLHNRSNTWQLLLIHPVEYKGLFLLRIAYYYDYTHVFSYSLFVSARSSASFLSSGPSRHLLRMQINWSRGYLSIPFLPQSPMH